MKFRSNGIFRLIFKALLFRFVGVWAYLFGGFSTRDVFIIPALAQKLGSFGIPGNILPVSTGGAGYTA